MKVSPSTYLQTDSEELCVVSLGALLQVAGHALHIRAIQGSIHLVQHKEWCRLVANSEQSEQEESESNSNVKLLRKLAIQ